MNVLGLGELHVERGATGPRSLHRLRGHRLYPAQGQRAKGSEIPSRVGVGTHIWSSGI